MARIKINDRFSIERDADSWILHEKNQGINPKTKLPMTGERQRYFPYLHQVVQMMVDLAPSEAHDMVSMVKVIEGIRADINRALLRGMNFGPSASVLSV